MIPQWPHLRKTVTVCSGRHQSSKGPGGQHDMKNSRGTGDISLEKKFKEIKVATGLKNLKFY